MSVRRRNDLARRKDYCKIGSRCVPPGAVVTVSKINNDTLMFHYFDELYGIIVPLIVWDGEVHMEEEYKKYRHELSKYIRQKKSKFSISSGAGGMSLGGGALSLPFIIGKQLADYVKRKHEPFNEYLFKLIDEKELKDSEVYKQAGLTRQMFSKIRCKSDYVPTKSVILSLAVGMHLTVTETEKLLASGNQILSMSDTRDLIIRFFLEREIYDIDLYNAYLYDYHQHLLGSSSREQ